MPRLNKTTKFYEITSKKLDLRLLRFKFFNYLNYIGEFMTSNLKDPMISSWIVFINSLPD